MDWAMGLMRVSVVAIAMERPIDIGDDDVGVVVI